MKQNKKKRTIAELMIALGDPPKAGVRQRDGSIVISPEAQLRLLDIELQMTREMGAILEHCSRFTDLREAHGNVLYGDSE